MARQNEHRQIETVSTTQVVLLADLHVDQSYQRGEKPSHIAKIAREFIGGATGILTVGRRADGTLWLIDGQQRRKALERLGVDRWPAEVIPSSGPAYEAAIYHKRNSSRVNLSPKDLFRAALEANDPVARECKAAVEAAGYRLTLFNGGSDDHNNINCVRTLYVVTRTHGGAVITRTLNVIRRAWPSGAGTRHELMPTGLIRLMIAQGDRVDDDRLVRVLSEHDPRGMEQDARFLDGDRRANLARVIAKAYNRRLSIRKRLIYQDVSLTEAGVDAGAEVEA